MAINKPLSLYSLRIERHYTHLEIQRIILLPFFPQSITILDYKIEAASEQHKAAARMEGRIIETEFSSRRLFWGQGNGNPTQQSNLDLRPQEHQEPDQSTDH